MQHIYLKDKSYSVENLPSEPSLLVELLDLCHNENANFEMFSSAIRKDAALYAKVIQVANSPAYRQWNQTSDIRRMLIVLGLENVRNIVVTCAIQQFFAQFSKKFSINVQYIWLRSLVCANLSLRIAKLSGYNKPGEAFLAGLMHQVGMLLLLLNREKDYLPLLERYYSCAEDFSMLERKAFQTDHCELGAALVESWKLDSFIADAVQFQKAPVDELKSAPLLIKIIAAASPLSSRNSARKNPGYRQRVGELFGLTDNTVLDCLETAVDLSKQMISDLGFSSRFYLEENEENFFFDEHNVRTKSQLARHVHNISLANTIGKSAKNEYTSFAKEIRATFSTLFNLSAMFFFKPDDKMENLTAINDLESSQLDEIEFSIADSYSLLVLAYKKGEGVFLNEGQGSIADKQIIRLLGSDIAYFLPLCHENKTLGVVALGFAVHEEELIKERLNLLKLLSQEIARKFFVINESVRALDGIPMPEFRKVVHEVSNPLTIISNYLYILGKKIESDHPAQEEISYINEEIERAGNILLRAKDPDTHKSDNNDQVSINSLIKDLDNLFGQSLFKANKIESSLTLDDSIPILYCSTDKLKQILINIIKNAVEAMQGGGLIEIVTKDNVYQNGKRYAEISIRDNGPGIPEEVLKYLFKPVTSTKAGHSGLGLSIVNNLVEELSGSISCHSKQNQGTEFKILIPRKEEQTETETK